MLNYNTLSVGLLCQDKEEYNFCYEAVREDFFDEISDMDFFEDGEEVSAPAPKRTMKEKMRAKASSAKGVAKNKAKAAGSAAKNKAKAAGGAAKNTAKAQIAKFKKLNRKQKAAIAAAIVALGAIVIAMKKKGAPEKVAKLEKRLDTYKAEADDAFNALLLAKDFSDREGSDQTENMRKYLATYNKAQKRVIALGKKISKTCKFWKVPFPDNLFSTPSEYNYFNSQDEPDDKE